ncbi:MAG: MBL-fold metallo-hydrolase superfamily, partial [uncultured Solirubrobacteraceae bacterium]
EQACRHHRGLLPQGDRQRLRRGGRRPHPRRHGHPRRGVEAARRRARGRPRAALHRAHPADPPPRRPRLQRGGARGDHRRRDPRLPGRRPVSHPGHRAAQAEGGHTARPWPRALRERGAAVEALARPRAGRPGRRRARRPVPRPGDAGPHRRPRLPAVGGARRAVHRRRGCEPHLRRPAPSRRRPPDRPDELPAPGRRALRGRLLRPRAHDRFGRRGAVRLL